MGQLRVSPGLIGAALAAAIVAVPTATATGTSSFAGRTVACQVLRNAAGRVIGTRIAVWLNKYVTEIAEGMLTNRPWFLYAPTICVPA